MLQRFPLPADDMIDVHFFGSEKEYQILVAVEPVGCNVELGLLLLLFPYIVFLLMCCFGLSCMYLVYFCCSSSIRTLTQVI